MLTEENTKRFFKALRQKCKRAAQNQDLERFEAYGYMLHAVGFVLDFPQEKLTEEINHILEECGLSDSTKH